jgi:protoporphyrinogen/coproporphyrinogen III oxidase
MKIAILGGGISGLSAAWTLFHSNPEADLVLLEGSGRLGGCIATITRKEMLFERGPRTFRSARSPFLLRLIEEVGLAEDLIFSASGSAKRYLWHRGALRSIPALCAPHLWRLLFTPFIAKKQHQEETVYQFFQRRFGTRLADLLADPLCLGIYAGDCHTLSVNACFPAWKGLETPLRSTKRFPGPLFTLRKGMQSLIDALSQRLPIDIRLHSKVLSLQRKQLWEIVTSQGICYADRIIFALPFPELKRLLPSAPLLDHASLLVANIGYSSLTFSHRGYGYLVPTQEQQFLLGMIWDSAIFPQQEGTRLTAMLRANTPDPEKEVRHILHTHLGITRIPDVLEITSQSHVIPQYSLGHRCRFSLWKKELLPNIMLGNCLDGVSVERCIAQALHTRV